MRSFFALLFCLVLLSCNTDKTVQQSFKPGDIWTDNNGVHINAHGGGILLFNDVYYWYGEHKIQGSNGNKAHVGVHVYSSTNLYDWTDEGIALSVIEDDTTHDISKLSIIERPKVIYNEFTNKFVMWSHLELRGQGYEAARTTVAVSNTPTGPFAYITSYRPNAGHWPLGFPDSLKNISVFDTISDRWSEKGREATKKGYYVVRDFEGGQMARDMTLFIDDDKKAYHIHSSEENQTIHISELSDDYLSFTGKYGRILSGGRNEAPAIIKRKGKYIMISSGLTGWKPNAARLSTADDILGPWTSHGNPCVGENADITFESQSTFILPIKGKEDTYIFMADRWRPKNAIDGRYVWLPIAFENDLPVLKWADEWSL